MVLLSRTIMAKNKAASGEVSDFLTEVGSNLSHGSGDSPYSCTFCKVVPPDDSLVQDCQEYADLKRTNQTRVGVDVFYTGFVRPRLIERGLHCGATAFRRHLRHCCEMGRIQRGG